MVRGPQAIQKVRSFVLLSLLACGGVAAQTPPTATLRQPRPVPGIEDPYPWSPPASPSAIAVLRNGLVYVAGHDLWASDGTTAGTRLIATLCPSCTEVVALGHGDDLAFFVERLRSYDFTWERVVRTDGTPAGTFQVTESLPVGYYGFTCPSAAVAGERLYFSRFTYDNNSFCKLWRSDGTVTGTVPLDPEVGVQGDLVPLGNAVYFLGARRATLGLWRASAETGHIELVQAFQTSVAGSHLTAVGRRLFFFGPEGSRGLWTSDGTASGTLRLTRFAVASGSQPLLVGLGGRAWFVAAAGDGEELWSSDGSVAGTRPATDFPDPHPFRAAPLTADKLAWLGSRLVFPAPYRDQVMLWSTSGDRSGTRRVQGCPGHCPVVAPKPLAVLGSRAVFVGKAADGTAELWVTDGSGPGTRRLRSARGFSRLTAAGGGVLFVEHGPGGLFVGVTDGTPAGTAGRLAVADPARKDLAAAVAALGGRILFPALAAGGGGALWSVRPGDAAAQEIFLPPPHAAQPQSDWRSFELLGSAGGRALAWRCTDNEFWGLLFATDSRQSVPLLGEEDEVSCDWTYAVPAGEGALIRVNQESDALGDSNWVWGTDGTPAGTFYIGPSDNKWSNFQGPVALANRALFLADDWPGIRLWQSDGTEAGTGTEVKLSSGLEGMTADGTRACFLERRQDPSGGPARRQLWCSDGTASGTRTVGPVLTNERLWSVRGLASLGGRIYACTESPPSLFGISDQGVTEVRLDDLGIDNCTGMTSAAGRLWISTGTYEREGLVVSDGTPAGTALLAELPGWKSDLIPLGGMVFFVVSTEGPSYYTDRVRELWRSDGTVSGTRPLLRMASNPDTPPVLAAGRLWFAG
ncbi:MAG: hypothetical protein ACJ75H_09675, partial [Thermoanaerobaculia bacterium]